MLGNKSVKGSLLMDVLDIRAEELSQVGRECGSSGIGWIGGNKNS